MSKIRLWKLGVLDGPNSIIPTKNAINRLRDILANLPREGIVDLVWGPELSVIEIEEGNNIENYVIESVEVGGFDAELVTIEMRKV